MSKKTTQYITELFGCHKSTANKWAQSNGVETLSGANGKTISFLWSDEDIERFRQRAKPGKRAKKKKVE